MLVPALLKQARRIAQSQPLDLRRDHHSNCAASPPPRRCQNFRIGRQQRRLPTGTNDLFQRQDRTRQINAIGDFAGLVRSALAAEPVSLVGANRQFTEMRKGKSVQKTIQALFPNPAEKVSRMLRGIFRHPRNLRHQIAHFIDPVGNCCNSRQPPSKRWSSFASVPKLPRIAKRSLVLFLYEFDPGRLEEPTSPFDQVLDQHAMRRD